MAEEYRGYRRRSSSSEQDDKDEIKNGMQITWRNTAWVYHDSSSLIPAQIMEQEMYYQLNEDSLYECFQILQMISLIYLSIDYGEFNFNISRISPNTINLYHSLSLSMVCTMKTNYTLSDAPHVLD